MLFVKFLVLPSFLLRSKNFVSHSSAHETYFCWHVSSARFLVHDSLPSFNVCLASALKLPIRFCLRTNELTDFMELSPSWEAASCATIQELPSILWNPKVHYRVHKIPPLVPIFSQIILVQTTPSYRSKVHFNIIHPPMSWISYWSLSFWILIFPSQLSWENLPIQTSCTPRTKSHVHFL
jgi:hypothetical protein